MKEFVSIGVKMNGVDMLIEFLRRENVDVIFGYLGGVVLLIYDKLYGLGMFYVFVCYE